jgi:DNA polymerase type B, organellar and viral
MLIVSLRNLGKVFGVDTQKSIFPYTFVNKNNLDYIGPVPDYKYFNNISIDEYNKYCEQFNNNWSLKEETIKYCESDCISLYQIILKFSNMIFELFKINIHNYSTLSSLAFGIFRTHFLRKNEIPQLSGQIENDLRQSYTGGAVDMYIPRIKKGDKIYCYDVNSLYPFVMKEFDMPTGKPILFYGDIRKVDQEAFGFFYCKIIAPDNLKHPILQTHVKVNKEIRTVAPLGSWEDMIFSEEMDNAKKYGYKFEILWGYKFERKNIFNGYVTALYELRLKFPKSNPLNLVAKLLLNSLYGRFGMIDSFPNITIFKNLKTFKSWFNIHNEDVISFNELGDRVLVKHRSELQNQQTELYGTLETHNISIAIASAITAYARIHMSQFKNNPKINLYYTDTDSIYTDSDIDESFISDTILGKLKIEHICKKAIFLSPKVYCLETIDKEFIYKVKGLKHEIELTMKDFKNLLCKDAFIEKFKTKWMKNLSKGQIKLLESIYTLKVTDNKRQLVYDKNNKLISTKAYRINKDKEII